MSQTEPVKESEVIKAEHAPAAETKEATAAPAVETKDATAAGTEATDGAKENAPAEPIESALNMVEKVVPRSSGLTAMGQEFIKSYIKDLVDDHEENPLLTLLPVLMEWIEKNSHGALSGPEKRKLVLNLLQYVADNADELKIPILQGHEDEARAFVRNILPNVIDMVISASKGKMELNPVVKSCLPWCLSCLGNFSKK